MSSAMKFVAVFLALVALCLSVEAQRHRRNPRDALIQHQLQKQHPGELNAAFFIVGGPANQEASDAGTDAEESDADAGSDSSSEDSSEEEADGGSDAAGGADAGGGAAASIFNDGNQPNLANARGGNILPLLSKFMIDGKGLGQGQGQRAASGAKSSAGPDVAIAFGVMALIAFVVGSVVFVIKNYRHNFPVIVRA